MCTRRDVAELRHEEIVNVEEADGHLSTAGGEYVKICYIADMPPDIINLSDVMVVNGLSTRSSQYRNGVSTVFKQNWMTKGAI